MDYRPCEFTSACSLVLILLHCSKKTRKTCPKCGEEISLNECFKDKAAENELKAATIKCTNQDCPWEGLGRFYKVGTCTSVCIYM